MNKPPVNSLSLEFLTDFTIMLEKLENEKSCKGMILTSVSMSAKKSYPVDFLYFLLLKSNYFLL